MILILLLILFGGAVLVTQILTRRYGYKNLVF